jgi:hypothetical protein
VISNPGAIKKKKMMILEAEPQSSRGEAPAEPGFLTWLNRQGCDMDMGEVW